MDKRLINFYRALSEFKSTSRIKECFYHKKEECRGDIKQSHSIQRNGRLSILENEVNGNNSIYTFTSFEASENRFRNKLKPIGKGTASTFFGFCDYHDNILFSDIENFKFNESEKHLFLHSYRSFAHSYHRKKEELKWLKSSSEPIKKLPDFIHKAQLNGVKMALEDMRKKRESLNDIIENEKYGELLYLYDVLPQTFPIACSTMITPDFTYHGTPFNNHNDPERHFSPIILTVLPDKNSTIIILACFPEDELAEQFIDELDGLYPHYFKKAISSLMITYAENTFFSPKFWKALGKKRQEVLIKELNQNPSTTWEKFRISEINFFEDQYSIEKLNQNT